jgi:hypothetical protein
LATAKIELKRGVVRGEDKKLGADSTLSLFWRGVRGQDETFEMLDKYDQSS